jgi:hypothetical protein
VAVITFLYICRYNSSSIYVFCKVSIVYMKQVNTEKQHICEASCSVDGRFVPGFFRNFADIVTFYTTQNV